MKTSIKKKNEERFFVSPYHLERPNTVHYVLFGLQLPEPFGL